MSPSSRSRSSRPNTRRATTSQDKFPSPLPPTPAGGGCGEILGAGVDILDLRRLPAENLRADDPFVRRVFTPREIAQAESAADPRDSYARRFAGKEAVFKAVRCSPDGVRGTDAEILDDGDGHPVCTLRGALARSAGEKGGTRMHVSLSREGALYVAFAVLEK